MPRNASFYCAAKIDFAGGQRFADKAPATSKGMPAPTDLNWLAARVLSKARERESGHGLPVMSPETTCRRRMKLDLSWSSFWVNFRRGYRYLLYRFSIYEPCYEQLLLERVGVFGLSVGACSG